MLSLPPLEAEHEEVDVEGTLLRFHVPVSPKFDVEFQKMNLNPHPSLLCFQQTHLTPSVGNLVFTFRQFYER